MERYLAIFCLTALGFALIYIFTACSRVITSSPKLVTSASSENNFYILPKKILKTTTTYEIEEGFDDKNNFVKTMGCNVKDEVKIEAQMIPDYDNIYELQNSNPSRFSLTLDYGAEGVGILAGINAEVTPEFTDILTGVVSVASQISNSGFLQGTRDVVSIAKTVKREVKIIQIVVPDKVPNLLTLNAPKFRDEYQPNGKVMINFASDIDDKQVSHTKKATAVSGIVYRLPIATQVDVLYGNGSDVASAVQISSQVLYFPQFGPLQVVPLNLSYNMFSGKRTINVAFNSNTGGVTKIMMTRESASKAAFESVRSSVQGIDKNIQDYKNKDSQQTALQKRLEELKAQKQVLDMEKQIKDLETANAGKKN